MVRLILAAMALAAAPSLVLACGNSFGKLDTHNAVWERVLGVTFDNPVIKASSMNDRCWVEDWIDTAALDQLAAEGIAQADNALIYRVPGVQITPDYATYSDDTEAYRNGQRRPLGVDVFRILIAAATPANIEAIRNQLSTRTITGDATKGKPTENSSAMTTFGDIEVEVFSTRVKTGLLGSGITQSAAMFTAPGDPRLLVIFLGDQNTETDRVGGIRLEETLHQTLRDLERASE